MDAIYQRMNDDMETLDVEKPQSEIKEFYRGKTIFLTGCTGFIGKCLVEKLLRTCWEMKKLYILVRPKKNRQSEERINHYFNNIVFDLLKKKRPNFLSKVEIITGDLYLPGMNLSPKDRQLLIETTDVIIHNASMVIFTAKISTLLKINVLGTKEMLDLASECRHLKCFMYVSTAYSHCYMKEIEEKFYPRPGDLQMVYDMIKADDENEAGLSNDAVAAMLHPFPNSYIYTKAIAESIVQDYAKKLPFPCGIFRMSIVLSTYKEPLASWCANLNGPVFSFVAASIGVLHILYITQEGPYDFIPADMTANSCLVAVWDLAENQKVCREGMVYNYGNSTINPIDSYDFEQKVYEAGYNYPSIKTSWKYFLIKCNNYRTLMLYHLLLHCIPALLVDIFSLLRLRKPKLIPFILRVNKHKNGLMYFLENVWKIKMGQMIRIWDRMNSTDSELFFCDLRKLDWDDYILTYWRGMRVYLLQDPMDTIEKARRKYKILICIHYFTVAALLLLAGYIFFKIVDTIFL